MDVKLLKYFLQICKDESFSKAAKNLYITQQGLSKAIKSLEEYVQAPLFYRTLNGVKLTEYGQYLEKQSNHIIQEIDLMLNNIKEMSNLNYGKLSVGFSFGVLNALSTDLISNFRQAYPNIELMTTEYPDMQGEEAVLNEKLDMALTIGPVDETKFHSIIIKTFYPCILVNKENPLSKKTSVDFSDINNEKFIIVDENFKLYHNFVNKCRDANFEPNILYTTAEIIITHKLSRLNKGLGISVDFVAKDIDYPNVYSLPFTDKSFVWDICLITKRDAFVSRAGKIFTNYVSNY